MKNVNYILISTVIAGVAIFGFGNTFAKVLHPYSYVIMIICCSVLVTLLAAKSGEKKTAVVGFGLLVAAFFSIPFISMSAHAVTNFSHLKVGMSDVEVESLIGAPSRFEDTANGRAWRYSGRTWCIIKIYFDKNDRLVKIEHDH